MAFTQADVDAIDRALASGELRVRIDDKEIEYQSAKDLLLRRQTIVSALAQAAAPTRTTPRYQLANFTDDGIQ